MEHLYMQGLQSLLVEGGNILLQSFIDAELWDEAFVEESPLTLLSGIKAPEIGNKAPCTNEVYFGRNFRHYSANKIRLTALFKGIFIEKNSHIIYNFI